MSDIITSFTGHYHFLSNFYASPIEIDGISYGSAEAAFQAQKASTEEEKRKFSGLPPHMAKKAGRNISLDVERWNRRKIPVMQYVVTEKFVQNPELAGKLLATGDAVLVEGNTWNDKFWGVDLKTNIGENNLGKILMQVRKDLPEILRRREQQEKQTRQEERPQQAPQKEEPNDADGFAVGQKVRIRQWDDMAERYGCINSIYGVRVVPSIACKFLFTSYMKYLCGKEAVVMKKLPCLSTEQYILKFSDEKLTDTNRWTFSADMLEAVEDEEKEGADEMIDASDYKNAFRVACELLNGDVLFGIDSDRIFEEVMKKEGCVGSDSYERYILEHLEYLMHGGR